MTLDERPAGGREFLPRTEFLTERGDLGGMSFGFLVPEGGETWSGNRRTLTALDLFEVSVVSSWPAYEGTTVTARARAPRLALARRYLQTCQSWE